MENEEVGINQVINTRIDGLTLFVRNMNYMENNNHLIGKKSDEISFTLKQISEGKIPVFKYVKNKWKYITYGECCSNNCVNTNNPNGLCSKGNGFPQIKSNTKIVYINCKRNGVNKLVRIESEYYFNKPIDELIQKFTLYYYEVKLIFEKNKWIWIGLTNGNDYIYLDPSSKSIYYSFQVKSINLPSFNYKTNDIIGCGLVYPPPKMTNKLPYIFFTQNGQQIGKAILLKKNNEFFKPSIWLFCCSIEANFGDNSFIYDVSKHCVTNGFYRYEEFKLI